jgi:hypothetical protein
LRLGCGHAGKVLKRELRKNHIDTTDRNVSRAQS